MHLKQQLLAGIQFQIFGRLIWVQVYQLSEIESKLCGRGGICEINQFNYRLPLAPVQFDLDFGIFQCIIYTRIGLKAHKMLIKSPHLNKQGHKNITKIWI